MKTDITLAICMYNAERYIEETLSCIMAQTMQDFHLLIINDCSTDSCVEIVERFFQKHPRQHELISLSKNAGTASARNLAITHPKTKYLIFVDADDCPHSTLVEKLYSKITSDPDLMAVGCHLEYMDSEGRKMNGGIYLGETTKERFYAKAAKEKLIFMQPTAIYERDYMLRAGGFAVDGFPSGKPRYQDLCEDVDLWTRMSDFYTEGKAIVVIPEVLCRYRKHETGMSSNTSAMMLRMRHVKTNLKRRRRGETELSFLSFREQMPKHEILKLERNAQAADALRRAYYLLRTHQWAAGAKSLISSIAANPSYFIDKLKHNFLKCK